MGLRKLLVRAVWLFALFYAITRPASAAALVNQIMSALYGVADNIAGFLNQLN